MKSNDWFLTNTFMYIVHVAAYCARSVNFVLSICNRKSGRSLCFKESSSHTCIRVKHKFLKTFLSTRMRVFGFASTFDQFHVHLCNKTQFVWTHCVTLILKALTRMLLRLKHKNMYYTWTCKLQVCLIGEPFATAYSYLVFDMKENHLMPK